MQWIGERFFLAGSTWIDAATGHAVRLRILRREDEDEIAWSEGCARLSTLRHPLLNPLLDYGAGPAGTRFEAYARGEPVPSGPAGDFAPRVLGHVAGTLRACEIELPPDRGAVAVRPVVPGRGSWPRLIATRLQGRRAIEAVEDVLDAGSPVGPAIITLAGACNAGLRTARTLLARSARLRGFVPVSPAIVRRFPELLGALRERHVCVLDDVEASGRSAAAASELISALAAGSARRHVVVRFQREPVSAPHVPLDALSVRELMGMVVIGGGMEPDEDELFAAARGADGLPGLFVARLCGQTPVTSRGMFVHESSPTYAPDTSAPAVPPVIAGRVLGGALRASGRAVTLAARGRHAVAVRVLQRAIRVLEGRDRRQEAARCAVQLGWLVLDRGATADARRHFERAQQIAKDDAVAITAMIGLGVTLVDECRGLEAEAALRGAIAAGETINDPGAVLAARAALARCLLWQDRHEEAVATAASCRDLSADGPAAVRLLAASARAQARLGRTSPAVKTAREAQRRAAPLDAQVQGSAELALAEALASASDQEGSRTALTRAIRLARNHHLPLVRVRATLAGAHAGGAQVSTRTLERLRRLRLPRLLAHRAATLAQAPARPRIEPVRTLEMLLDRSQRAADDAAAAAEICRVAAECLGAQTVGIFGGDDRTLAVHGRGWSRVPQAVAQAIAQGSALHPAGPDEPREWVEPIRYGGEIIAAIACRWLAGATIDADGAVVLMHAAALSAAPHVRAMLDRPVAPPSNGWGDLLGDSAAAAGLRESVARAARAPFPVLVEGESGCGKELVARAIHRHGPRRDRRFCALNCAALTEDLVETELFGHARGAFTGAASERAGLFEDADGGTLFLDEVAELSPRAQAKLLRVLQEGEVRRVGENFPRRVDVRVVAATNRRLEEEAAAGRFRADLRFRLDVVRITVPPLRERAGDIPILAAHFWQDASARVGSRATLSGETLAALARYDWPGNVRELQNVIAWMAVHSPRRGRVGPSALPLHVAQAVVPVACTFEAAREEFERRFVRAALAGANGQRSRAAEALGVTRQGLSKMMRRLRIEGA